MRPGDRIYDEYTLVRPLGRGAFGDVWLANQERLRREVALKFAMASLLEGVSGGPARFAQEAIIHGQLDHRHIVPLFDARSHEGAPFLVMPYLRGGSLADKAEQLTTADLVRHGVAVCDALAYAHKRHVIHRDIKPMNLLLDDDGEVRVADFGIARLLDEVKGSSGTRATVAGTEGFAAPEQLRGERVDLRADVYGLGATLVYLATGRSPIDLIMRQREKLLDRVGKVAPALRVVLDKMTQEEPDSRYVDASQARAALLSVIGAAATGPRLAAVATPVVAQGVVQRAPVDVPKVQASAAPPPVKRAPAPPAPPARRPTFAARPAEAPKHWAIWGWALVLMACLLLFIDSLHDGEKKPPAIQVKPEVVATKTPAAATPPAPATALPAKPGPAATPSAGQTWTGASGYVMVWVPAGTFEMGSPPSEEGRYRDEKRHRVTLPSGYWAGEGEVTQGLWSTVTGSNPSGFPACGSDCPVEQVSWCDSVSFANALSSKDGLRASYTGVDGCAANPGGVTWDRSADGYRLATEAEWEMAARGGGRSGVYAGGELDAVAWYRGNADFATHRVCAKQANALGICDASGNVWEWTWDWYGDYPGRVTDPVGPGSGSSRVIRGGSWDDYPRDVRLAYRNNSSVDRRTRDLGLRLVSSSIVP